MHHVLLSALGLFADKCYCLKNNLNKNKMQHNFFSENKFFLLHSFLYIYEKADCSNSGLFKFNSTKKIKVKYTLCPLQQMVAKLHMITLCSQEPSSAYLFILKKKKKHDTVSMLHSVEQDQSRSCFLWSHSPLGLRRLMKSNPSFIKIQGWGLIIKRWRGRRPGGKVNPH